MTVETGRKSLLKMYCEKNKNHKFPHSFLSPFSLVGDNFRRS